MRRPPPSDVTTEGSSRPESGADRPRFHWRAGAHLVDLARPRVMGIVNVTPDSFSDGGRDQRAAIALCEALLRDGADMLDIGGESTRPGSVMPSEVEELARVLPVVRHAATLGVPVSVDTSRPGVMQAVLDAGADIINDVRALRWPGAMDVAAVHPSAGVCLMHMAGEPTTMQLEPMQGDVVVSVRDFLRERLLASTRSGMSPDRIVLDPGIGFGKTPEHNLELLSRQRELLTLGRPLLVGWSRKSTLGVVTGRAVHDRVAASVAAALAAVTAGANIVRVHDVAPTVDALKVWHAAGRC